MTVNERSGFRHHLPQHTWVAWSGYDPTSLQSDVLEQGDVDQDLKTLEQHYMDYCRDPDPLSWNESFQWSSAEARRRAAGVNQLKPAGQEGSPRTSGLLFPAATSVKQLLPIREKNHLSQQKLFLWVLTDSEQHTCRMDQKEEIQPYDFSFVSHITEDLEDQEMLMMASGPDE